MSKIFYNDVIFCLFDLIYENFEDLKNQGTIDDKNETIKKITEKLNHNFKNKYKLKKSITEIDVISYLYCYLFNPLNKKKKIFPATKTGRESPWRTNAVFIPQDARSRKLLLRSLVENKDLIKKLKDEHYSEEFIGKILAIYNDNLSIQENILNISDYFSLYVTETVFILISQEKLCFDNEQSLYVKK